MSHRVALVLLLSGEAAADLPRFVSDRHVGNGGEGMDRSRKVAQPSSGVEVREIYPHPVEPVVSANPRRLRYGVRFTGRIGQSPAREVWDPLLRLGPSCLEYFCDRDVTTYHDV